MSLDEKQATKPAGGGDDDDDDDDDEEEEAIDMDGKQFFNQFFLNKF